MFKRKGQGSLEYLLLIGGAVLVAAIVIALVVSSAGTGADVTKCNAAKALCNSKYTTSALCNNGSVAVSGTTYNCLWVAANNACMSTTALGCT